MQASFHFRAAVTIMVILEPKKINSVTAEKAEHHRINTFELWCYRRLLRVPWVKFKGLLYIIWFQMAFIGNLSRSILSMDCLPDPMLGGWTKMDKTCFHTFLENVSILSSFD